MNIRLRSYFRLKQPRESYGTWLEKEIKSFCLIHHVVPHNHRFDHFSLVSPEDNDVFDRYLVDKVREEAKL
jgi:hypothetical protein